MACGVSRCAGRRPELRVNDPAREVTPNWEGLCCRIPDRSEAPLPNHIHKSIRVVNGIRPLRRIWGEHWPRFAESVRWVTWRA